MSRDPLRIHSFEIFHKFAARHDSMLEESIFTSSGILTSFWRRPGVKTSTFIDPSQYRMILRYSQLKKICGIFNSYRLV